MREKVYRVNAVMPDGNPWEIGRLPASEALAKVRALRAESPFERSRTVFWIDDPDDEEQGDVESDLEEEEDDLILLAQIDSAAGHVFELKDDGDPADVYDWTTLAAHLARKRAGEAIA
jgi:hypothetical protein